MYLSLSDHGDLTECVYVTALVVPSSHCRSEHCPQFNLFIRLRSSDLPQFLSKNSIPSASCMGATIHFASMTQSDGPQMKGEAPGFLPADQKHVELVPGRLTYSFAHESTRVKDALTRQETAKNTFSQ